MGIPSGIGAQLMMSTPEGTYGTYVAPDRALDLVNESIKLKIERLESKGLRAGRLIIQSPQWTASKTSFAGDLSLELANVSQGRLWDHTLGSSTVSIGRTVSDGVTVNTSPVVTSATAAFVAADAGRSISGSGIPNNTTIAQVVSATTVTMSANATAGASGVSVTIGTVGANVIQTIPGDLTGKSFTAQIGRPEIGGTSQAFSYLGCKVAKAALSCKAGAYAELKVSLIGQAESTAQTLTTPFYPVGTRSVTDGATNSNTTVTSNTAKFSSRDLGAPISGGSIVAGSTITAVGSATSVTISQAAGTTATGATLTIGAPAMTPLSFVGGFLKVNGTQVDVKDVALNIDNHLDAARFFLRSAGTPKEPLQIDFKEITGSLTADFTDLTLYGFYTAANEVPLVLNFVGGQIGATGVNYSVVITCNVRFDGDTANVAGPQTLEQPVSFKAIAPGIDASAITVAITTSDTAL